MSAKMSAKNSNSAPVQTKKIISSISNEKNEMDYRIIGERVKAGMVPLKCLCEKTNYSHGSKVTAMRVPHTLSVIDT